jgi:hypothetical protein
MLVLILLIILIDLRVIRLETTVSIVFKFLLGGESQRVVLSEAGDRFLAMQVLGDISVFSIAGLKFPTLSLRFI